jgi:hypothetical protein
MEIVMLDKPSLMLRIGIGKGVGLVFGLAGFLLMPYFLPDAGWLLRWGVLLWYITVGAFIGVFGVVTYHPVLKLPMPWWFRSILVGAWMNFVLTFFAYDAMADMIAAMFGTDGIISSPFWFTLEGAIIGLVIGYFATRFGGEGKETVGR